VVQIPVDIDAPELNRKKETRIYYRQLSDPNGDGERVWIPTLPLPADPWHLNYYTKKGFKLWPPGKEPGQAELSETQAKVAELEEQAKALKDGMAESETAKEEIEAEVKALEEQAANLKAQVGEVKLDSSKGKISCPEPDCSFVAKTYIGLARHMRSKHGTK